MKSDWIRTRHRNPESRKKHEAMSFFDGRGTVATRLETSAKSLAP
jgi:hypothetical protein